MRMLIPKGPTRHEDEVEWRIPKVWNAFERNRARAYHYLFSQIVGLENVLQAYDLWRKGEREVASLGHKELEKVVQKAEGVGVGYWGAGRGYLSHWVVIEKGKIVNYQIITPSTINASPRDPWDQPGAYEESIMNTPILERFDVPEAFTSIDMLRAVRSFDPCMPCTTHVDSGAGIVVREVNTCACGAD
jgi:hydrogenase large subunit